MWLGLGLRLFSLRACRRCREVSFPILFCMSCRRSRLSKNQDGFVGVHSLTVTPHIQGRGTKTWRIPDLPDPDGCYAELLVIVESPNSDTGPGRC